MKSTAHWFVLKGHTAKCPAGEFDEEFAEQIFATGKIEEGRVVRNFFRRTGQPLAQDWLIEMAQRIVKKLPFLMMLRMGLAAVFRPRTRQWGKARGALVEYAAEHEAAQRRAVPRTVTVALSAQVADEPARAARPSEEVKA